MVAGDSLHERKVGVAAGFPIRQLKRHEAITTNDVLAVLGAKAGDQVQVSVSVKGDLKFKSGSNWSRLTVMTVFSSTSSK